MTRDETIRTIKNAIVKAVIAEYSDRAIATLSVSEASGYVYDALRAAGVIPAEGTEETPKIVCLCGSGRFREAFDDAEFNETLAGRIVLTIGCNTKDIARDIDWHHVKPMLDELHLRKIDLADEVYVQNVGGYIGDSTANEIAYATSKGKPIRYLEPIGDLDSIPAAPTGEETP